MLLDRLKDQPWAEVPSPAAYHSLFKALLARANMPLDAYPYTTKSLAYESVRRDLKERWVLFCQAFKARKAAFIGSATDHSRPLLYDRIEIDEQLVDCEESTQGIELILGDNLPPLRLPRFTLIAAIDKATDCCLAFHLVLKAHATQDDVLSLLFQCLTPCPERAITTDGLQLPPGPAFPNMDPSLPFGVPREIALDNAWIHHAFSVKAFCTRKLKATVSYGKPKTPTLRLAIETSFNRVNHGLTHRLNSTTGSSVTDDKRESAKNRKGVPTISLSDFEDALYVTLAESNHRPRPYLNGATPLETLRYQAERTYLVDVDDDQRAAWNPFLETREITVHDLSAPGRRPYVNFEYLRYKGPGLLALPGRESRVLIQYDRRNVRQLAAYRLNGQALGTLECPVSWQSYPHSIATRRYLFQHCRELVRKSQDPLTEYLLRLRERCSHPTDAARYLSTYQEFVGGYGLPTALWPKPPTDQSEATDSQTERSTRSHAGSLVTNRTTGHPYDYWSMDLNPGGSR
ncbi:hypothetical protein FDP08_02275 [Marinobacter panjinensis]|uniref:Transposase family protein n=1 Tax=Marinobacter panjinensis TaxID=2576384 RepID=A0A4U6R3X4_9GAMM|nr:hypothetical protein [Marinobacter panjinensis]MCR8916042.1 hypothetical protein [Marinobacter panjinensis]TKV66996.1 hypothetical protein FDP08_02275 [Marinobacter panjinensis]